MLSVCFQIISLHFDLEIDVLTFKMNWIMKIVSEMNFPVKNIYEEVLHFIPAVLVTKNIFDLENEMFAYLTLQFKFWPWNVL